MKQEIEEAFKERRSCVNINLKVNNAIKKLDNLLTEYICYNLSATENKVLATFTCGMKTLIIDNPYGEDNKLNISEYACSFTDELEWFIIDYCKDNNLQFNSYGDYNSCSNGIIGKKFWIYEKGEKND